MRASGMAARAQTTALAGLVGLIWMMGAAEAADLAEPAYYPALRYFPRSDEEVVRRAPPPVPVAACLPGSAIVPTNGPFDPSYVGSSFGLGKPSYYGLTPPPGIDDPYGRRLRICP
nr:hypothetical protein [Methylobacterium nodulans]